MKIPISLILTTLLSAVAALKKSPLSPKDASAQVGEKSALKAGQHELMLFPHSVLAFAASVLVGTPNQDMSMLISTVSLDSTLNSLQCESVVCQRSSSRFNSSESSTFQYQSEELYAVKQPGSLMTGRASTDIWNFAGMTLDEQPFLELWSVEAGESDVILSGQLGLAPGVNGKAGSTLIGRMVEKNLLDKPVVGLWLPAMDELPIGKLTFGYTDRTRNATALQSFPRMQPKWPLWTVEVTGFSYNDQMMGFNGIGVLDSSSTFMFVPLTIGRMLAEIVGATPVQQLDTELYQFDCAKYDNLPPVTLYLAGKPFVLTKEFYAFTLTSPVCYLQIAGSNEKYTGKAIWRLGIPFLRQYYTAYNYDTNEVSLAVARHSSLKSTGGLPFEKKQKHH